MQSARPLSPRQNSRGIAVLEMAFMLPVLLLLTLPVIDFARAIQANQILVNVTREGASLASRAQNVTPQDIMNSLTATTPPLQMPQRGMIYITKIMGYCATSGPGCVASNIILEQNRWLGGWQSANGSAPVSQIWACGSSSTAWGGDGSCSGIQSGAKAPTTSFMSGKLNDGNVVYVVETYYNFNMFFSDLSILDWTMPTIGPNLYSYTAF